MNESKPIDGVRLLSVSPRFFKPPIIEKLTTQKATEVVNFHQSIPGYEQTPLHSLKSFAQNIGISHVLVKDESSRFNLQAFKVLGSSYAMARFLQDSVKENMKAKAITFATATDGNHGRGVAWSAKIFGCQAVIYLPHGTAKRRVEAIEELGAKAVVTTQNYDDTVRQVHNDALKYGWQIIQDTATEPESITPLRIMQGYLTMAHEIKEQLKTQELRKPTHIILQAGVGTMAAAIIGYWINSFDIRPKFILLEPENAACFYNSATADSEKPLVAEGSLESIMAGLCCGEPNPQAYNLIKEFTSVYLSCADYVSAEGVRILARPLQTDPAILAGESGSPGIGLLSLLKHSPSLRKSLAIEKNSCVLIFNTEGITDPLTNEMILKKNAWPSPN